MADDSGAFLNPFEDGKDDRRCDDILPDVSCQKLTFLTPYLLQAPFGNFDVVNRRLAGDILNLKGLCTNCRLIRYHLMSCFCLWR